jgi:hypothetical protein
MHFTRFMYDTQAHKIDFAGYTQYLKWTTSVLHDLILFYFHLCSTALLFNNSIVPHHIHEGTKILMNTFYHNISLVQRLQES